MGWEKADEHIVGKFLSQFEKTTEDK